MRVRGLTAAAVTLATLVATPSAGSEAQPTSGTASAVQALAFDAAGHPKAEAVDLYKFLHQALFGPGHAVTDAAQAADALNRELAALGASLFDENWCDALGGDPLLVRVNLRPFAANGFASGALVESFVATANSVRGDPQQMGVAIGLVVHWLNTEDRKDLARGLEELAREMEPKGYPAVHHSAAYVEAYRPAYRVVEASMASSHGWCGSTF